MTHNPQNKECHLNYRNHKPENNCGGICTYPIPSTIEERFDKKFSVLESGDSDGTFTLEVGDKVETSNERAHSFIRTEISLALKNREEELREEELREELKSVLAILDEQIGRMEKRKSWQGQRVRFDLEEARKIILSLLTPKK